MKALKINTATRTVEEIQINHYKEIYDHIGNGCTCFSAPIAFDNNDTLYTDDEGLYHEFEGGIMMKDWSYPLVGNSVLQGTDYNGESVDVMTTKEELEALIIWVSKEDCERWAAQFN